MTELLRRLLSPVRGLFHWTVALLILFEEWGWEPLARALGRLAQWPPVQALEARISRLPSYAALAVFVLPGLLLLPVKLLAVAAIAHGHALAGLLVIVAAKLLGTAVVARLYLLTQPALLQLAWFRRWHGRWIAWKTALLLRVRASVPWRVARVLRRQVRQQWARWRHQLG